MRAQAFWMAIAVLTILGAAAQAQTEFQTYTPIIKDNPDVGKSVESRAAWKIAATFKTADSTGKVLGETAMTQTNEEVSTMTVLAKGDKQRDKYKMFFEKAVQEEAGKVTPFSYQGRMILFERKGDKFTVTRRGGTRLHREDLEPLVNRANVQLKQDYNELIMPKKPVQVGESWPVASKELAKELAKGLNIDVARTKAQAKLARVYQKDGKQFGVIELEMKLVLDSLKQGGREVKFDLPAALDVKATLDTAIDGSTTAGIMTMTGKLTGIIQLEQSGMNLSIQLNMDINSKEEHSAEK